MNERKQPVTSAPAILVTPVTEEGPDQESEALSKNPKFMAILEQARAEKGRGGFSSEEMREWLETELPASEAQSGDSLADEKVSEIETITVYKLPTLSREEIEAMFGLEDLKKTRYFQEVAEEAKLEGKLESVPGLLAIGLSAEQIAGALGLDVEQVMQAAREQSAGANSNGE